MNANLEKNKPLAREITRRLLDSWRLKRGYRYRSEKRVTHRKLYLTLMKELMHEIGQRSIEVILEERIHFFNHNYQTALSLEQFNDLMSSSYQPPELPSDNDNSMHMDGDDDMDPDTTMQDIANFESMFHIEGNETKESNVQDHLAKATGLGSLHGYESDNEGLADSFNNPSEDDIVPPGTDSNEKDIAREVEITAIKLKIEHALKERSKSQEITAVETTMKSDIRSLFHENELLRAELEPMLVYRDDPDMYERIIAPDIRGKKFKVSNDGRCPKCHYRKNVFVILDFLFPMGDMPDICNYLIAKGQAVLWSSQDDSHCKDPPTLLCRGKCPADPAKCGFNLNWNRTDLESILLFPEEEEEHKNVSKQVIKQLEVSSEEKQNELKLPPSTQDVPTTVNVESESSANLAKDGVENENKFDEGQVDLQHYKKSVSWVVLDDFTEPNEEVDEDEDKLIKTMLALSSAKEDWEQGTAKLWSDESGDESGGEAVGVLEGGSGEGLDKGNLDQEASKKEGTIKADIGKLDKRSYAFSWSSFGSNPWAPVDFDKKRTQNPESKLVMIATGKDHVPQLLNPINQPDKQQEDLAKEVSATTGNSTGPEDSNSTKNEEGVTASGADTNKETSDESEAKESVASSSEEKSSNEKKTYTADDYPISKDGTCPYCKSKQVVYIIIREEEEEEQDDDELPDILKRLLKCNFAYKMSKDENEPPSFQCLSCTYGFNLDWRSTDLDAIFSEQLEQAENPAEEHSAHDVHDDRGNQVESAANVSNYGYQMPAQAMSGNAYQNFYAAQMMGMAYYSQMAYPAMPFVPGYYPPPPGYMGFPPMGYPGYMPGPQFMPQPMQGGPPASPYNPRQNVPRRSMNVSSERSRKQASSGAPSLSKNTPSLQKSVLTKGTITKGGITKIDGKIVNDGTRNIISDSSQDTDAESQVASKDIDSDQATTTKIPDEKSEIKNIEDTKVEEKDRDDSFKQHLPAATETIEIVHFNENGSSQSNVSGTGTSASEVLPSALCSEGTDAVEVFTHAQSAEPLPPGTTEAISENIVEHATPSDLSQDITERPLCVNDSVSNEEPPPGISVSTETAATRQAGSDDIIEEMDDDEDGSCVERKRPKLEDTGDDIEESSEPEDAEATGTKTKKITQSKGRGRGKGRGKVRGRGRGRGKGAKGKKT